MQPTSTNRPATNRPAARRHLGAMLAVLLTAGGCAPDAEIGGSPPEAPLWLSETGFALDASGTAVGEGLRSFSPQYPLWTDGATKRRWIRLPTASAIDASDPAAWSFPVGTQLWKEFSFGARIETRYMERLPDGEWLYATYLWRPGANDAERAPAGGVRGACRTELGTLHDVPSSSDCRACHEGHPSRVLGFGALQLADERDPLAPHAEPVRTGDLTLHSLLEAGLVRGDRAALVAASTPMQATATPRERATLGYLHANCSGCHNSRGPLATLGLDLELRNSATPPAVASTVDVESRYLPMGATNAQRIVPGAPAVSVLYQRLTSRFGPMQMPPLGTHARDEVASRLIGEWILHDLAPQLAAAETSTVGR